MAAPAAAHVFVRDVDALDVDAADAHHLARVLRLRPGEDVTVSDGAGALRLCVVTATTRSGVVLEPSGPVEHVVRPAPPITVAFAITKGDKPEWTVMKLTELGVDRIVPFVAARSVVRWDDERAGRHAARWRVVARGAAMQSRRSWLPEVADVATFDRVVTDLAASAALAELGGTAPNLSRPAILVGPEGGWSEAERDCGLPVVGLGDGVLRAETAAVTAGALFCAIRARLVKPEGQ